MTTDSLAPPRSGTTATLALTAHLGDVPHAAPGAPAPQVDDQPVEARLTAGMGVGDRRRGHPVEDLGSEPQLAAVAAQVAAVEAAETGARAAADIPAMAKATTSGRMSFLLGLLLFMMSPLRTVTSFGHGGDALPADSAHTGGQES